MTSQFDGYESETLFNSMQEGGEGVFSLMVDPKKIVNVGEEFDSVLPLGSEKKSRPVLVGQELHVGLTERSVSPIAGDVKVVWSNGFEGDTYHVQPEDLGTTLTAVATFEGADMRPLAVTIECGPVILAPAPEIDISRITVSGEGVRGDEHDMYALREYKMAHLYVDSEAFSSPVDAINVRWFVDGNLISEQDGIEPKVLTSALDLERLVMSAKQPETEAPIIELPQTISELPNMLADLLLGQAIPGLGDIPAVSADLNEDLAEMIASAVGISSSAELLPNAAPESIQADQGDQTGSEGESVVDVTDPFFTASVKIPQGVSGGALSVEVTGVASGTESATVKMFAGIIEQGLSYALKPDVAIRVADPRVGEEAWAKVKRKDFTPTAEKFAYQWLVGGEELYGETKSTIDVTSQMRGRELSVLIEVQGSNAVTSTLQASLGVVGLGDAPEYLGEALEIKGKARVGKTLTLKLEHDFVYPVPDSIEVQWMRGREPIVGARELTYQIGIEDTDEKLWARVLLRKFGHASTVLKTSKVRVKG